MKLILNRKDAAPNHAVEQVLNVEDNTIEIYDTIVPWKFDAEDSQVTVQDITGALKNLSGDVTVRINSRGGEVGTALTIYNRLRDHTGNVHTVVDGYAFSSAGWVAQAGDTRSIATGGVFMIHNPMMVAEIDSLNDIETVRNQWLAHQRSILDIFSDKVPLDEEELKNLMDKETFLSAEDAVEKGFFDSIHNKQANLSALNYAAPATLPSCFRKTIPSETVNTEPLLRQRDRLVKIGLFRP